ncbi:MAG: hypothetical protein PHD76_14625 [Methylacidiphilales bacterium]|nr:hypothetical protein [Candidatus Methylacidiphilales bacterium]
MKICCRNILMPVLLVLASFSRLSAQAVENWASQDVGSPSITGSTSYNQATDTFTIQGSGNQIDGVTDSFQFAYLTLVGNVEITTRVVSQTNTSGYANAGVMIRESLAANATYAMVSANVR